MKSQTLTRLGSRGILIAGATVVLFASLVMFAQADSAPSVTATAYVQGNNAAITSAPLGAQVLVVATVASSSTTTLPTGTITFTRYNNTSCTGTPNVQAGVPLVNGVATSSVIAMTSGGLSYMAHYSGDTYNVSADSTCRPITSTASNPTLSQTLSASSVYAGSQASSSVTLSNVTSNAGGSVNYAVYSNNSCTALWGNAGSKTVTNGVVAASDPFLFNIAGAYYWRAVYSGDAYNAQATSSCLALSVLATTTPPASTGSIAGAVYNDANQNDVRDSGEAGVAGFTINLYKGAGWWGKDGLNDPMKSVVTDANGTYTFGTLENGTYSVELIKKAGYKQTSDDFRSVTISNGSTFTANFSVVANATSSNNHHDNDEDNDDRGNKGGKGNHWGWANFFDRFGSFPWGIGKNK